MKYTFVPRMDDHYATNLHIDNELKRFEWDNSNAQDVMIIQTPYGESIEQHEKTICHGLEKTEVKPNQFTKIADEIWALKIPFSRKNQGWKIQRIVCRYTVMAYIENNDEVQIITPQEEGMNRPFCDVALHIYYKVEKYMCDKRCGLLGLQKKKVFSGFYTIEFDIDGTGDSDPLFYYEDASVSYGFTFSDDFRIPVTREMIRQKIIYVETEQKPIVESKGNGVKLTEK